MKKIVIPIFLILVLLCLLFLVSPTSHSTISTTLTGNDILYCRMAVPEKDFEIPLYLSPAAASDGCYMPLYQGGIIAAQDMDLHEILTVDTFVHIRGEELHMVLECVRKDQINWFEYFYLLYSQDTDGDIVVVDKNYLYKLVVL